MAESGAACNIIVKIVLHYSCLIGCTNGTIRLAGTGSSSTQGRVEVCNNNQWGTVCDDTWGNLDASVACLHLGYSNEGMFSSCYMSYINYVPKVAYPYLEILDKLWSIYEQLVYIIMPSL